MEFKHYVGIDISKNTLDIALISKPQDSPCYLKISNNKDGFKQLSSWLKKVEGFNFCTTLFCMEHTGVYNNPILNYLSQFPCKVWVENAVHIQKTIGLQRGKNDKVDAQRIAIYASKNIADLKEFKPKRAEIEHLKVLSSLRDQLV